MMNYEEIEYRLKWLQELLRTFIQFMNIEEELLTLSISSLINVVMDADEDTRRIKQNHNMMEVSVAREVSLYCYYILKRKPIMVIDDTKEYASQINEKFCVFLLMSCAENKEIWDQDYIRFLISMFYRGELSKDAIYLLTMTVRQVDKLGGDKDGI